MRPEDLLDIPPFEGIGDRTDLWKPRGGKMCDCYEHPCMICGKDIPMHLGDFDTAREEVLVFHKACLEERMYEDEGDGVGKVVILETTENAHANRGKNHLNC